MLMNGSMKRKLNVLAYGESGTGKSSLGATAPEPVILLSETQGFESVRDACTRLSLPLPPVFLIDSRDKLAKALEILAINKTDPLVEMCRHFCGDSADDAIKTLPYVKPQSVVADSLSDQMDLVWKQLMKEAPPKQAKDNLPDTSPRHWNAMKERATRLVKMYRDLDYHVVFLCGLDDREVGDEDSKGRQVGPSMPMRKLPSVVMQACNAVGITRMRRKARKEGEEGDVDIERYVQFSAPDYMMSKPLRPLHDIEVSNVADWIARWEASIPAVAQAIKSASTMSFDDDEKEQKTPPTTPPPPVTPPKRSRRSVTNEEG